MANIPRQLTLSADDIRFLRHYQLELLTGIHASNFCAWTSHRHISEKNLNRISQSLGMEKSEFLKGLELRRKDNQAARVAQEKGDQLIAFLGEQKTA